MDQDNLIFLSYLRPIVDILPIFGPPLAAFEQKSFLPNGLFSSCSIGFRSAENEEDGSKRPIWPIDFMKVPLSESVSAPEGWEVSSYDFQHLLDADFQKHFEVYMIFKRQKREEETPLVDVFLLYAHREFKVPRDFGYKMKEIPVELPQLGGGMKLFCCLKQGQKHKEGDDR